ncbi:MAG: hypothetical protein ACYDHH_31815 [Solirubrobacteraceae bacterium]
MTAFVANHQPGVGRILEDAAGGEAGFPSFSSRTIVYKGMLTAPQLPR